MSHNAHAAPATTIGSSQRTFLSWITDVLIYMVVIVLFHHHPFLHNDRFLKLLDARELMRILTGVCI